MKSKIMKYLLKKYNKDLVKWNLQHVEDRLHMQIRYNISYANSSKADKKVIKKDTERLLNQYYVIREILEDIQEGKLNV